MADPASLAAAALRAARTGGRIAGLAPEIAPASVEEAYRVQDLVLGDAPVAGWKIGATAAPGAWSCAALAASTRLADGGRLRTGGDPLELEVEIAIRIAADLPAGRRYPRSEVAAALGGAHAAFEIVGSRFIDRKAVPSLSTLADAQSCTAFAVGAGGAGAGGAGAGGGGDWQDLDLTALDVTLSADGRELARVRGGASASQTLDALTWLANHAAARGRGLTAGQLVITGARIGPIPLPAATGIVAEIAPFGTVAISLR